MMDLRDGEGGLRWDLGEEGLDEDPPQWGWPP